MNGIAPGLDGFLAARRESAMQGQQGLQQMQGMLGIQQAMAQQQESQQTQQLKGLLGQKLQAGDTEGARGILMQMKPELFAGGLVPQSPKWTATEITQPDGTKKKGYVDINSPTPETTFRPLGVEPVKQEFINGVPVNPYTQKTPVKDINKPFVYGEDGAPMPNAAYQDYEFKKSVLGKPSISNKVTMAQETEENKAIGKELGQQYADLQKGGMQAPTRISKLQRMAQLSDGVTTGALTPALTDVAALADSLGVKVDKNLGAKQAFEALSNEVALGLRSTADGGGMPGAMSDKDREFLKAMTPSLSKTPEGNKLIIESGIKLEQRKQQVAQMSRQYRAQNKTLEGFSDALQKWSDANPIFTAPTQAKPTGAKFLGFE